jgi:Tol biopolymer transport system component
MHAIHRRPASMPRRHVLARTSRVGLCVAALALLPTLSLAADPPIKLNAPLTEGGDVSFPIISPDGSTVVYAADQEIDGRTEQYSVPIGGGSTPIKLNPPVGGSGVFSVLTRITADSTAAVFRANGNLFSAPINGGTPVRLNRPLPAGGIVFSFQLSPDGSTVVYNADQDTDNVREIYSVPVAGGTVTRLNASMTAGGNSFSSGRISPDGGTVIYRADQDTDEVFELYSVPISGGSVTKLNPPLPSGADVGDENFEFSPDGSTVVFAVTEGTLGRRALYSVPAQGGPATRLTPPLVDGGRINFLGFDRYRMISPEGSRVVYTADQDTDDQVELYSVPIEGGTVTRLNPPLLPGQVVDSLHEVSADGSTVVYQTFSESEPSEVFSVPTVGGPVTRLNAPLPSTDEVLSFQLSHDGSFVVYTTFPRDAIPPSPSKASVSPKGDFSLPTGLFSAPIDGGPVQTLATGFAEGSGLNDFSISPDNQSVIYTADQDTPGTFELYRVSRLGGPVEKLNAPVVSGGNIFSFEIAPDSNTVVYRGDQDTDDVFELFSVTNVGAPQPGQIFENGFE